MLHSAEKNRNGAGRWLTKGARRAIEHQASSGGHGRGHVRLGGQQVSNGRVPYFCLRPVRRYQGAGWIQVHAPATHSFLTSAAADTNGMGWGGGRPWAGTPRGLIKRSRDEWDKLAAWVCDNKVFSPNVRWLIQVPRLYAIYKASGLITTFEDLIKSA